MCSSEKTGLGRDVAVYDHYDAQSGGGEMSINKSRL